MERLHSVLLVAIVAPLPLAHVQGGEKDAEDDDTRQHQGEDLKGPERAIVDELGVTRARQAKHDVEVGAVAAQPEEKDVRAEGLVDLFRLLLDILVGAEGLGAGTCRRWPVTPGDVVQVAEGVNGEDVDEHRDEHNV